MNYYNEFDPNAAAWLRELISSKLIPAGYVDERSIEDVRADDIRGYTQCHFFAGIGGWSLALQLAGWPGDRPVWTGSCPCQPYSTAGKQRGNADARDLWPPFFRLVAECRPEFVFGEQVENAIRHGWLDRVYADLEGEGYSVGAAVLGAHSVGAPHRRYRLYWGGVRVADSESERFKKYGGHFHGSEKRPSVGREFISMAYPDEPGLPRRLPFECTDKFNSRSCSMEGISPWRDSKLIFCRNGKTRRIPPESLLFRLADGIPESMDGGRVTGISEDEGFPLTTQTEGISMLLKGYGNAIVPQVAAEFVRSFIDAKHDCFGD